MYLIEGEPGTGKTTLALQFLLEGRRLGEESLYVTLSQTTEELNHVAASHGWTLDGVATFQIVVDDESTRDVVATALEAAHAEVQAAASALEAKEWLQHHAPALIIADLGMPVEDGFSLIRDIRTRLASDVPAIALSAYADQPSRDAALAAGFNAFLAKPTRTDALLQLVAAMFE